MGKEQRRDPDYAFILTVLLLLGLSLIMVFSASYIISAESSRGDPYFFLRRQAVWIGLGLVGMLALSRFPYHRLRRMSPFLLLVSFILLVLVYIPGIGVEIYDARRWIGLGPITVQPAEFCKLAFMIFTAAYMSSRSIRLEKFWSSSFVPLALMGVAFFLILKQPDYGTSLLLAAATVTVIFLAGLPFKQAAGIFLVSLPAMIILAIKEPYRLQRLTSFLDPWADPGDSGHQIIQSLFALGPGHIFGVGLGRSRQKLYYLPLPHSDFIFAIIGEELGFVGAVMVLLLFFILFWRGIRIAMLAPDSFGSLLAAGITSLLAIQVMMNIAVVTGSIPVTGVTLPLISAGGSSLFFTLCGFGILLNISRHLQEVGG
ncbi:MAG: putative lipid II flippase FtsW [Firmicutes bacterium]|nr:putative lipid II flippase FtsW [Bacillota bacterium]